MASREDLDQWVEAGLIDAETAQAIMEFESGNSRKGRVGRGMEAIAYLGAVLVLIALAVLAGQFWDRIEPWGRLTLSSVVALVLITVGIMLARSEEPAVNRAQTFAWLLAVAAVALTVQVAVGDLAAVDEQHVFLWVALSSLLASTILWVLRNSVLQMVALGVSAGATVIAILSQIRATPDWAFGLGFAGLGVAWFLLTWAGIFRPTRTSYAIAAVGILLIAFPESTNLPWPILGLLSGLALMALSVLLEENILLGLGVAGLFIYIPMTIFEVFGDSLGVPVALLITGLILLAVVVVTMRARREM